tara:strand:- start:6253 stop:7395 length:1143 start_codon:yes stop_codon:yes gene_type:complete
MKYSLNKPSQSNLEKKYILDVLKSNWLSSNGEHTIEFEKKFSKFLGLKFGLAVQSGTSAIHVALKAAGVKEKDFVITPNYTCISNLSCISQCNAIPVIVEIEKDTLGLDYESVKKAIKIYKPKVLQLVHVYGYPARDTKKIIDICKKNKIIVIEDSSEAFGSSINSKKIGTFGQINVTSIRSEKMIGVGEGGILTFNNRYYYEKAKLIASRHAPFRRGKDPYWKKYFSNGEGYNYLMPHLLGAVARGQIETFKNKMLIKKIFVGKTYRKISKKNKILMTQSIPKNFKPVFWLNSIYFKDLKKKQVNKIGEYLMKKGIEVRSGFWPLNKQKGFKFKYINGVNQNSKNLSNKIFEKSLVLPSSIDLREKDIDYILKTVKNLL